MLTKWCEPLPVEQATDGAGRVAEMVAHRAAQVRLVGESEVGRERGEVVGAGLQPVEGPFDPDAVPVPGERHAEVPAARRRRRCARSTCASM